MEGGRVVRRSVRKAVKFCEQEVAAAPQQEEGEMSSLQKTQDFLSWKRKIRPLLELLQKTPTTELEILCCEDENDDVCHDDGLLDKCKVVWNYFIFLNFKLLIN
jgi:hypothetical protein